jgi:uncharacterized repeat protein (TIGR03806 family)
MPLCVRLLSLALLLVTGCSQDRRPVTLHPADEFPQRLSEWHVLVADGDRLRLNDAVIPYDLNTPLFSDYALKLRTVWMPEGEGAAYREDREFDFPVGTILSKTFHYRYGDPGGFRKLDGEAVLERDGSLNLDKHRIVETRLLIHYEDGWRALPYVWNEQQTEAFLEIAGAEFDFRFANDDGRREPFIYIVPDMNQCSACHAPDHSSKDIRPLGLKGSQLNREFAYVDGTASQLEFWSVSGRLTGVAAAPVQVARWSQRGEESLAGLARAYLDVNCGHCHNPDGAADTSALNLNLHANVDRSFGICKPPVAVGRGSGNRPYDIYPGRPEDSILLYRMEHDDPAIMMPELGRAVSHEEGVAVIRDWIAALPGKC